MSDMDAVYLERDQLAATAARLRVALEQLHDALKAQTPPLPMGYALAHAWMNAALVLNPKVEGPGAP